MQDSFEGCDNKLEARTIVLSGIFLIILNTLFLFLFLLRSSYRTLCMHKAREKNIRNDATESRSRYFWRKYRPVFIFVRNRHGCHRGIWYFSPGGNQLYDLTYFWTRRGVDASSDTLKNTTAIALGKAVAFLFFFFTPRYGDSGKMTTATD